MHHNVEITDPAIVAAATLSHRYITDRQLPDKAIDLIDEAASRIRMEMDSKPEEMDRLDRRIIQLKMEREALKKETDEASRKRLQAHRRAAGESLGQEYADLEEIWKAEKASAQGAAQITQELERRATRLRDRASRRRPRAHVGAAVRHASRTREAPQVGAGSGSRPRRRSCATR